jgi:hypothetical protein
MPHGYCGASTAIAEGAQLTIPHAVCQRAIVGPLGPVRLELRHAASATVARKLLQIGVMLSVE